MTVAPPGEPLLTEAGEEVGKAGVGIEAPPESASYPKGRKLLVQESRPQASTTAPCCVPVDLSLHLSEPHFLDNGLSMTWVAPRIIEKSVKSEAYSKCSINV